MCGLERNRRRRRRQRIVAFNEEAVRMDQLWRKAGGIALTCPLHAASIRTATDVQGEGDEEGQVEMREREGGDKSARPAALPFPRLIAASGGMFFTARAVVRFSTVSPFYVSVCTCLGRCRQNNAQKWPSEHTRTPAGSFFSAHEFCPGKKKKKSGEEAAAVAPRFRSRGEAGNRPCFLPRPSGRVIYARGQRKPGVNRSVFFSESCTTDR